MYTTLFKGYDIKLFISFYTKNNYIHCYNTNIDLKLKEDK